MTKRVQFSRVDFSGGHPAQMEPHAGGVLVLDADGLHYRKVREVFCIPWADIESTEVVGPDVAQSRVTFTRMATIGLFAFAAKKKGGESYLTVTGKTGAQLGFRIPKVSEVEVTAAVQSFAISAAPTAWS